MAIYLDSSQRKYLKQLLKKHPSDWWAHKKIEEQIIEEENHLSNQELCSHNFAEFLGVKDQCLQCGYSHGFSWTRRDFINSPQDTTTGDSST